MSLAETNSSFRFRLRGRGSPVTARLAFLNCSRIGVREPDPGFEISAFGSRSRRGAGEGAMTGVGKLASAMNSSRWGASG